MARRGIENGDADRISATIAHQNAIVGHFSLGRLLRTLKADIEHIRVRIIVDPKALSQKCQQQRDGASHYCISFIFIRRWSDSMEEAGALCRTIRTRN